MITLSLLKSELPEFLVNDSLASRLPEWIYWVQRDLVNYYDWWWNKEKTSFTTVASQAEYILDHRVDGKKIKWMGNEDDRRDAMKEVNLENIYQTDSTPTDSGTPDWWAFVKQTEISKDNSIAAVLSVVSTSAADTMKVVVRGKVSGLEDSEEVDLTGVSSNPGSKVWDANSLESVTLASASAGTITATVSTDTIVELSPGMLRKQSPRIRLWRVPGSAIVIPYIFHKKPLKVTKEGDIIDIPDEAFRALIKGVLEWGYRNNGDVDFAQQMRAEYEDEKKKLRSRAEKEFDSDRRKLFGRPSTRLAFRLPRTLNGTAP